ncbi:MAG: hypothetical protein WBS19_00745 [Candidatus Korobacteraceae bacterium]
MFGQGIAAETVPCHPKASDYGIGFVAHSAQGDVTAGTAAGL